MSTCGRAGPPARNLEATFGPGGPARHPARVGRGPEAQLLPIRYGRMLQTPFTFYRGSAAVMAADLAKTPATGIRVQACGDCHLLNFGGFATPERNILLDINDFDETLPAPWEWDVKRLAASFVLAAPAMAVRRRGPRRGGHLRAQLPRAHGRVCADEPLERLVCAHRRGGFHSLASKTGMAREGRGAADRQGERRSGSELDYPKLAGMVGGQIRIQDNPPLIFHPEGARAPEFHRADREACSPTIERLWPKIAASCSTAIAWWMRRSRWSASAASGRDAGSR